MKKLVLVVVIIILATASILYINQTKSEEIKNTTHQSPVLSSPHVAQIEEKVNYTAGFAIFTSGTLRIFSDPKYHNQSEIVSLQADNPNIIYVKKQGITWNDFFRTLPFKLTKDCLTTGTGQTFCTNTSGKLSFYLNNIENPNALDKVINKGDRLLVTYGNEDKEQIHEQLQRIPSVQ